MSAQTLVGAAAVGLVAAHEWTSPDRQALVSLVTHQGADVPAGHAALKRLAELLLFVVAAVILAGVSSQWATVVGVGVAALWVLFLMHRNQRSPAP